VNFKWKRHDERQQQKNEIKGMHNYRVLERDGSTHVIIALDEVITKMYHTKKRSISFISFIVALTHTFRNCNCPSAYKNSLVKSLQYAR
jgi:hypothetical protein